MRLACVPVRGCPGDGASYLAVRSTARYLGHVPRRSDHRGKRAHGVSDEDILHAYANPIRVFDLDEGFTMVIGANLAAITRSVSSTVSRQRSSSRR
jgi:hypothetical protein